MNIRKLLEALNPSRKVLLWVAGTAVAAIPTVWLVSSKISSTKVLEDQRLLSLETSVNGLHTKVDDLNDNFESGILRIADLVKTLQTEQNRNLQFVVNNWSESNRQLISDALTRSQEMFDNQVDQIVNGVITGITQVPVEEQDNTRVEQQPRIVFQALDDDGNTRYYEEMSISIEKLNEISNNFRLLDVKPNSDNTYNVTYRDLTQQELKN